MPCDSVITNEVTIRKMHPALLDGALAMIGAQYIGKTAGQVSFSIRGRRYTINGDTLESTADNVGEIADQLKRAYSAQVVKYAAHRNGWQLRQIGQFDYEVTKG